MPTKTRVFPARSLEVAMRVPSALKDKNGGNPWGSAEVASALGVGKGTPNFFYITASARDYGLTKGTRDSAEISLESLGRRAVYPASDDEKRRTLVEAFFKVDLFKRVVDHYSGSKLPEEPYIGNTLEQEFGLPREQHADFLRIFDENARFVGVGADWKGAPAGIAAAPIIRSSTLAKMSEPVNGVCFVIMPFVERDDAHEPGFFSEVFRSLFTPAIVAAGFQPKTAARQGSDVIQSTIVSELLAADHAQVNLPRVAH